MYVRIARVAKRGCALTPKKTLSDSMEQVYEDARRFYPKKVKVTARRDGALMGGGMARTTFQWLEPHARSVLRIVAGFMFSLHGFQKLFGLFGGMGGSGAHAQFLSLPWVAGVLETFGGVLIMLGLFTVPAAFILSGQMAVAYFMAHMPKGFWPIRNGGELAALYSFVFLYLFTAGPGPWSFDRWFRKKSK